MATPEYDLLKMAESILETEKEVQDIYSNPEGEAGDLSSDQYEAQEDLKVDSWSDAVSLAEAVKAYLEDR